MLQTVAVTAATSSTTLAASSPLTSAISRSSLLPFSKFPTTPSSFPHNSRPLPSSSRFSPPSRTPLRPMSSWLGKLGLGFGNRAGPAAMDASSSVAQGPDDDIPAAGQQFAQFGAGCFWGVELALQRVPGVSKTAVGYSQGVVDNPAYNDVCSGLTNHSEVVRVQYDPAECKYEDLLDVFWARHDPTTLNRQLYLGSVLPNIVSRQNDEYEETMRQITSSENIELADCCDV